MVATGRNAVGGTAPHLEELLSHLSEQLCFFVQARMEIADFYEKMYSLSTQKYINSEELINVFKSTLKRYSSRLVCVHCTEWLEICKILINMVKVTILSSWALGNCIFTVILPIVRKWFTMLSGCFRTFQSSQQHWNSAVVYYLILNSNSKLTRSSIG